jgi:hypothetical protein
MIRKKIKHFEYLTTQGKIIVTALLFIIGDAICAIYSKGFFVINVLEIFK